MNITQLPNEILIKILYYSNIQSIKNLSSVHPVFFNIYQIKKKTTKYLEIINQNNNLQLIKNIISLIKIGYRYCEVEFTYNKHLNNIYKIVNITNHLSPLSIYLENGIVITLNDTNIHYDPIFYNIKSFKIITKSYFKYKIRPLYLINY